MSKLRNVRTLYKGRWYASKREATYARYLDALVASGEVVSWEPQVRFPLHFDGKSIGHYIPDFRVTYPDRTELIEVKGFETELWKWKYKHFQAEYPGLILTIVK